MDDLLRPAPTLMSQNIGRYWCSRDEMLLWHSYYGYPARVTSICNYWAADTSSVRNYTAYDSFLHDQHYNNLPGHDKLHKVRLGLNTLNERFVTVVTTGPAVSVNEEMIAYNGRSSMKQYMPLKPVKQEFKSWATACPNSGTDWVGTCTRLSCMQQSGTASR